MGGGKGTEEWEKAQRGREEMLGKEMGGGKKPKDIKDKETTFDGRREGAVRVERICLARRQYQGRGSCPTLTARGNRVFGF